MEVFRYDEMNKEKWNLYKKSLRIAINETVPRGSTDSLEYVLNSNIKCTNSQEILDNIALK